MGDVRGFGPEMEVLSDEPRVKFQEPSDDFGFKGAVWGFSRSGILCVVSREEGVVDAATARGLRGVADKVHLLCGSVVFVR